MERVFITGATGCVGQYLVDALAETHAYEIHALVRPGARRPEPVMQRTRAIWHEGALERVRDHAELIRTCDILLHLAAAWDDSPRAFEINVDRTIDLVESCDSGRCRRIVVFSTASVLGPRNELLDAARDCGTAYIRSKSEAYRRLQASSLRDRIVMICPTLVFGGDDHHRWSHVARELANARRYLRLARFVRGDGAFHFIHARDLAALVLAAMAPGSALGTIESGPVVPGQAPVTVDEALAALCAVEGLRYRGWLALTPGRVRLACRLLGVRLSAWDRYCIDHPNLVYRVTRPEDVGLASGFPTLSSVIGPA
jgi:nucleoside-diphosphate-sugar epimerase